VTAVRIAGGVVLLLAIVGGGFRFREAAIAHHFALGEAALARDDFEAAIASYTRALRMAPGRGDVHHQIGVAHALRGDFDRAILHLHEAERLHPSPEGRADLARAYADRLRLKESQASKPR
jgi:Flp pilus assembly protein TadD